MAHAVTTHCALAMRLETAPNYNCVARPDFGMTVTVCPAATINAPIERVWSLLMDPTKWTDWSTARLEAAAPNGPLHAGQQLHFSSRAFGRRWHAVTTVRSIAVERHSVDVDVSVPFGIINHEHLSLVSLPDRRTHVQFG